MNIEPHLRRLAPARALCLLSLLVLAGCVPGSLVVAERVTPTETPHVIEPTIEPTEEPTPEPSPEETLELPPEPDPPPGIKGGESLETQCGKGRDGRDVRIEESHRSGHAVYISPGETHTVHAKAWAVDQTTYARYDAGARLLWTLKDNIGGSAYISGCEATYYAPESVPSGADWISIGVNVVPTSTPSPQPTRAGEGGPRNVGGDYYQIGVRPSGGGGGGGSRCGSEYLAVSFSGPYSTSANWFVYAGPSTGGQWAGPFRNRGTFQVAPGLYTARVQWEDGSTSQGNANVPSCGYGKIAYSR